MGLVLKTLKNIKDSTWLDVAGTLDLPFSHAKWDYSSSISIESIDYWEQLFFVPGAIGIYAAYSPYVEYYIIVHNLFLEISEGIEEFYGPGASKSLWIRAKELKIELPTTEMWVSDKDLWLYDNIN